MGVKKPATYAGDCQVCGTHYNQGQEVYMEKQGEKWIICVDLECFKGQGGKIEQKKQFQGRKRLTLEEARGTSQKAWAYAQEDAAQTCPIPTETNTASATSTPDPAVIKAVETQHELAKMFYKGYVELMK